MKPEASGGKNSHIQHHFVPRFLLEEWTGQDKKLGVFKRLPNGMLKFDRRSPKAVAKIEHLYSVRAAASKPDVFIEKDIMGPHLDDIAAPIHQQLLAAGVESLSEEQRFIWSRFLVAGMFRQPFMVKHFREMGRQRVLATRGEEAASEPMAMDEGLKEFVLAIGSPKYNLRMRSANWWIADVPRGRWDALIADLPFLYFGDFFYSDFGFVTPISPKRYFICASGTYIEKIDSMNPVWMVKASNKRIVQHASKYVFTTDERHSCIVDKWLKEKE